MRRFWFGRPRAPRECAPSAPLAGASARPLNFTVRVRDKDQKKSGERDEGEEPRQRHFVWRQRIRARRYGSSARNVEPRTQRAESGVL